MHRMAGMCFTYGCKVLHKQLALVINLVCLQYLITLDLSDLLVNSLVDSGDGFIVPQFSVRYGGGAAFQRAWASCEEGAAVYMRKRRALTNCRLGRRASSPDHGILEIAPYTTQAHETLCEGVTSALPCQQGGFPYLPLTR